MKKLLWTVLFVAGVAGLARAEDAGYQVFQTYMGGDAGKPQSPVVIKMDKSSGDSWRLVVSNGSYWWIPIKAGVIKSAASEEKPAEVPVEPVKN